MVYLKILLPCDIYVNAFVDDWGNDLNCLCPPIWSIGSEIRHLKLCKAKGTLYVGNSKSTWAMAGKRQPLRSSVNLRRLQQTKENVLVDELACVDPGRGQKAPVWKRKPVWFRPVKRKCPCGRVGLCRPAQKLESVWVDEKACLG